MTASYEALARKISLAHDFVKRDGDSYECRFCEDDVDTDHEEWCSVLIARTLARVAIEAKIEALDTLATPLNIDSGTEFGPSALRIISRTKDELRTQLAA